MIKLFILIALVQVCFAPPTKEKHHEEESQDSDGLEDVVEYHRYVREVVKLLESDPTFREKLSNAKDPDVRSGKIADDLEFVAHHVRTKLDEVKRIELHRLKQLAAQRSVLLNNELDRNDPLHHHIDSDNSHTFEVEDLKRLIIKTTKDIAEADQKRREQFKEYELQKEYEKLEKLNHTNGDDRAKLEKEYKDMEEKHRKHEKLHAPGHKQQLEEVWKEQDHMTQEFNPKVFFMLHDLDGNGLWDQDEVKALFIKELDKMYAAGAPEDDMMERVEEMERMREAVFQEIDLNTDGFIDYNEFVYQTKRTNFNKDPAWKGIDEEKPFTNEELDAYVARHQANFQQQPYYPNPHMQPPQGYHPQQGQMPPPGYPQGHMPPPQGYQAPPQGQMHPQAHMQQQGYQQGQMPQQGQFHPGQLPQAQVNPQQIQNQVHHPNAGQQNNENIPNLNTNEVYPNQQQQFNQQPQAPMQQQQQMKQAPPPPQQQQYQQQKPAANPPASQEQVHQPQPPNVQKLNNVPQKRAQVEQAQQKNRL